jgi:hypothetical protein
MFGRAMNELKDYTSAEPKLIDINDWKEHQEKVISLIYPAVADRIRGQKDKMVTALNKHRRILLPNALPTGATVMLKDVTRENKFEPKYVGPFTVVRRARFGAYVLKDATGDILDRHVPIDQLKIVSARGRVVDAANNVYTVKKIHQHRGEPGNYEYLIEWKGYHGENTWEPESNILDDPVVKRYWKSQH